MPGQKYKFCSASLLLDIFELVFLRDLQILSIGHQFVGLELTKGLVVHSKEHLQPTLLNIVLPKENNISGSSKPAVT